jgi:23S rRNA pseudouridine1911/1915/1917 synthase
MPDVSGASRVALHASKLAFAHPATGKRMTWHSPVPADLAGLVSRLRKRARGEAKDQSSP